MSFNLKMYKFFINIAYGIIMLILLLLLMLGKQPIKCFYKKQELYLKECEIKKLKIYIKNTQEMNHKLLAQSHDYNHHISCIYGLLEMNKIEEVKKYTKKLVLDMQSINNIVHADNAAVSALLNYKLSYAKKKGINLDIKVNIPECLNIDPIDLSIILGNAIDNAIEACQELEDSYISVHLNMNKEYLIIMITNTMGNKSIKVNEIYKTIKQEREEHGFGIENIKQVVDKYDGLMKIEEVDNIFRIKFAIKNCGC